jgi:hypothetical protein
MGDSWADHTFRRKEFDERTGFCVSGLAFCVLGVHHIQALAGLLAAFGMTLPIEEALRPRPLACVRQLPYPGELVSCA